MTDLFVNKVNYFKHCENLGSTIALAYHSDILVQKGNILTLKGEASKTQIGVVSEIACPMEV